MMAGKVDRSLVFPVYMPRNKIRRRAQIYGAVTNPRQTGLNLPTRQSGQQDHSLPREMHALVIEIDLDNIWIGGSIIGVAFMQKHLAKDMGTHLQPTKGSVLPD